MRKRLLGAVFTVVATATVLFGTQTTALAETKANQWVSQETDTGYCWAGVFTRLHSDGKLYAYGAFQNYTAGMACTGWLERSTNNGNSWYVISGYHVVGTDPVTDDATTGDYYDGNLYLARACFHLDFSGAAHHCTYAF